MQENIFWISNAICKGGEIMTNKRVNLKKVNKVNNSTVKTLDCHCGCSGKPVSAYSKGYVGMFL